MYAVSMFDYKKRLSEVKKMSRTDRIELGKELLNELKAKNIPVAIFISSLVKGSHGPWPVSDGLPTIEEHRDMPIEEQLKQEAI